MNQDDEAPLLTLEEALKSDTLNPETRKLLEEAYKKNMLISRNKAEDLIRLTPPKKEAQRYTDLENQKIYEAAEKGIFCFF